MFERELQELHDYYQRHTQEIARAGQLIDDANLRGLESLIARTWIYGPTDVERAETHPDWPAWEHPWRGVVHVHLYIPFDLKEQARAICFASGLEWHKSYKLDNASGPRKVDFFVETWEWSADPESRYESDGITLEFYRPVQEGEVINDCKVVKHTRQSNEYTELVLSCKMNQE